MATPGWAAETGGGLQGKRTGCGVIDSRSAASRVAGCRPEGDNEPAGSDATSCGTGAQRFIFITGGVVSSLGKGLIAASLGTLLQARGFKVRLRKIDPYLNVDSGTMNPLQHGEVFVTDDGAETDLDLGHYERFTGIAARRCDSITAGRVYLNVIKQERKGSYLGETVQVVPHITGEIQRLIKDQLEDEDFVICEIGGTVGDIECLPFLEAIRQFGNEHGRQRTLFVHVTPIVYLNTSNENKTKPTQHSVREISAAGIQPDILVCRTAPRQSISADERLKIARHCNLPFERIIEAPYVEPIYRAPLEHHRNGLDEQSLSYFGIAGGQRSGDLERWRQIVQTATNPAGAVEIALVGKYTSLSDSYKSVIEALAHGGIEQNVAVRIIPIEAEEIERTSAGEQLGKVHGVIIPGGFGRRGSEGMIRAVEFARTGDVPYFGICLGMQIAVIEAARNLAGIARAGSSEFDIHAIPVIEHVQHLVHLNRTQPIPQEDKGGTLRRGSHDITLCRKARISAIYGQAVIRERYRHRYGINSRYHAASCNGFHSLGERDGVGGGTLLEFLEGCGLKACGHSQTETVEAVEISTHRWFIGVQFHPELRSRPFEPHPLFGAFIGAAKDFASSC